MTGDWRDLAACKNTAISGWGSCHDPRRDGELDVEFRQRIREAKRMCARCPVTAPCLAEAKANHELGCWGGHVFGGLSSDRWRIAQPRELASCGTTAGYNVHRRAGEVPCGACRTAERDRSRRSRKVRVS